VTAFFGHLGVEWNLLDLAEDELDALADVIALHRRFRPLLHGGDVVRFDTEPSLVAHGVYAMDRSEAIVSVARLATGLSLTPPPLVLPGLDPDTSYLVEQLTFAGRRPIGPNRVPPDWVEGGVRLSGRALGSVGLQLPALHPETAILIHVH
jgi:alpha-galactosidase